MSIRGEQKVDRCEFPNCRSNRVHGIYCIGHAKMMGVAKPPAEKKPIAKRSEKLKGEMKEYKPQVQAYLAQPESQACKIQSPVCTQKATCVNHKKRRGLNLRNEQFWEPSCSPCNGFIESNVKWAMDNGHLISVHKVAKS